jgi:bifunctional N-acetylglucosamine-1-phosphate-uridyltransferase/glucosamine-1-phosphate-acetyltransferase GlmU-like protein
MRPWTGVALAHCAPPEDRMVSRFPTCLHPLAGRPLCWHVMAALSRGAHPPAEILMLGGPDLTTEAFADLPSRPGLALWTGDALDAQFATVDADRDLLVVDAALVMAAAEAERLAGGDQARVFHTAEGQPAAVWIPAAERQRAEGADGIAATALRFAHVEPEPLPGAGVLVRNRAGLSQATALVRDRIVRRLMDGGVTVMLPQSVLVDVDVTVGRDTVLYPGVMLEGQTSIGEETVVGPGCRIVDSWIGSGVELKGWNFIAHTSVRNRAVLEPYVRRGFD